ncbi:MAG: hypothetical protein J5I93_17150, partial [Pirellulaceae bacterium]|nr:hypothetical protein [Pirellulaceae bacterium]
IEATVLGGSAAIAAGGAAGFAGSGVGVRSENTLAADVRASIDGDRDQGITAASLRMHAEDTSTIQADTGAVSLAASLSGGAAVALSVGVAEATNVIRNNVSAYLANAGSVTTTAGGISITADEEATITARTVSVAAAAALAPAGVAISGGSTTALNELNSTVTAYLEHVPAAVSHGAVSISASDVTTISSEVASASLAAGLVGVAIGLAESRNVMNDQVSARIDDAVLTVSSGDLSVTAQSTPTTTTRGAVAALSVGLGAAGAGAKAVAEIRGSTTAEIDGGTLQASSGDVIVRAVSTSAARPTVDGAAVGLVGITNLNVISKLETSTRAAVGQGATLRAPQGKVAVEAVSNSQADARTRSVAGGVIQASLSRPEAIVTGQTTAELLGNVTSGDGLPGASTIVVLADAIDYAAAGAEASGGGLVSVDKSNVVANASPSISAKAGGNLRASGEISIRSKATTDSDASSRSNTGGLVAVTDLDAAASSTPVVMTEIAADSLIVAGATLTVSSAHGSATAADPVSDGTFDAAATVDPGTDTITLAARHALLSGDTVTYLANGNTVVGGLTDNRQYGVIVTGDTTLQFGATFITGGMNSQVDLASDEIRFPFAHNLASGDRVIYRPADDAASIGGLAVGATYQVVRVDATTIKLLDPNQLPAPAQNFSGANVTGNTIAIPAHGFAAGQAVTYHQPAGFEFTVGNVAAAEDTLRVGDGHGLAAGDEVIYTASNSVIGGLVSGQRYFVIFDSATPDVIKLARTRAEALGDPGNPTGTPPVPPTPPTAIDLVPSTASSDKFHQHDLRKVADQPIGGLVDGTTYYVANVTAGGFQLASDPAGSMIVALNPLDPVSGAVLTGSNRVGTEGLDLTNAGNGQQFLVLDITADGGGTQRLDGVGGARALSFAPTGDGIVTSAASGTSGGLIRVSGATTKAISSPIVTTTVAPRGDLRGDDLIVEANNWGHTTASSANSGGGVVSVGIAKAEVTMNQQVTVTIGDAARLLAEDDLRVASLLSLNASILADTNGGGLVDVGDGTAKATLGHASHVNVGTGATLEAGDELLARAITELDVDARTNVDVSGLVGGAAATADIGLGGANDGARTTIGAQAQLKGNRVEVVARTSEAHVRATANGEANALGAGASADAPLKLQDTALVRLQGGSTITGDDVLIRAAHDMMSVMSTTDADCDCGVGGASATSTIDYQTTSRVEAALGATVAARDLLVEAEQDILLYNRSARADVAFLGHESENEEGELNAARRILWQGNVVLLAGPSPDLLVDANGRVVRAENVTVNGGQGQGAVITAAVISVDPILNDDDAGSVRFATNTVAMHDDQEAPAGSIQGMGGTVSSAANYKSVTIEHLGDRQLILHDMQLANPNARPTVELDSEEVTLEFNVSSRVEPTDVVIRNDGAADVLIDGVIDNPIGRTTILNTGGGILGTPAGLVRSHTLAVDAAAALGTAANRLAVQLVYAGGAPTDLEARAGQELYLDLQGVERGAGSPATAFGSQSIIAGGDVDLLLQSGLQQNTPLGKAGGIRVTVTQENLTADYVEKFRPDPEMPVSPDLDVRVFPDFAQSVEVPATFTFDNIEGDDIRIFAAHWLPTDARVSFQANTDVAADGQIDARTNGSLTIREVRGDLRFGDIVSTADDVTLFACNGPTQFPLGGHETCGPVVNEPATTILSLAPASDTTPHVIGNSVTLEMTAGLGSLSDFFEINSSNHASGVVRVIARDGVYLTETQGDLILDGVSSDHDDVVLQTVSGSILDGIVEFPGDLADVQGTDIDLIVRGGGIGTADNPVEIYGAGSFQQHHLREITTGVPREGRLYAVAPDSIHLRQVNARLNVLLVESASGDVALYVLDSLAAIEGTSTPLPEDFLLLAGGTTQLGQAIASGLVSAVGGTVLIDAGDDVLLPAGTLIVADSLAVIRGDFQGAQSPTGEGDPGTTITILGDVQADEVQVMGGNDLDFIQILGTAGINAGGTTTLLGNDGSDRFFVQAVINAMTIDGGVGADRYYLSSNAAKSVFSAQGFFDDTNVDPFDLLDGVLTDVRAPVTIRTGDGGNQGTRDVIFADSSGSHAALTGTLDYDATSQVDSLSGLGMPASIDVVIPDGQSAFLMVGLGSAADAFQVRGAGPRLVAEIGGREGNDTLQVHDQANSLAGISGIVTFDGGAGQDTLNVRGNATAPADATTGVDPDQVSAISVAGLEMGTNALFSTHERFGAGYDNNLGADYPAAIYFATRTTTNGVDAFHSTVETVNVLLGAGDDTLAIDSVNDYATTNVHGGQGDDTLTVSSTSTGLYPNDTGRVDFLFGRLNVHGDTGTDTVVADDSGDDNANTGMYRGATLTGLDMPASGALTFATMDAIVIKLGVQADTFYVPETSSDLSVTVQTGGGFDKVYLGTVAGQESTGTLDDLLGALLIEGNGPDADDELFFNDQANATGQTYQISNAVTGFRELVTGVQWPIDTTTFQRAGIAPVQYRSLETVVLSAGSAADTVHLHGTHREQSPAGGKAS